MTRLRTCHNPPPTGKNKFARNALKVSTKGSGTLILIPIVFHAPIPASTQALASAQTFASALGLPGMYTNMNLQRVTRLTSLELFIKGQEHSQLQTNSVFCNCSFNAMNINLYYGSSYMKCYYFCRQYEDHFDMTGTMSPQYISFVALFFWDKINFR